MNNLKLELQAFYTLVESLEKIPAIGKKSAQKIAYALSVEDRFLGLKIANAIENATQVLQSCQLCNGLSESEICHICSDELRENGELCIVLNQKDIFTLEGINTFNGRYFVLNDSLDSVDFAFLKERIEKENIKEIIFAFSPSVANDTMALFIEDRINMPHINFSKIAHGVPTGIGLDSIDQNSLAQALNARTKIL